MGVGVNEEGRELKTECFVEVVKMAVGIAYVLFDGEEAG